MTWSQFRSMRTLEKEIRQLVSFWPHLSYRRNSDYVEFHGENKETKSKENKQIKNLSICKDQDFTQGNCVKNALLSIVKVATGKATLNN